MKIVIYGNGAMAKVLFSYARDSFAVAGFTVDGACIAAGVDTFCGLPLVAFDKLVGEFPPQTHKMIVAVGFSEMNELRVRKYNEARDRGYNFESYIHRSVIRHIDVEIGENTVILDQVSIHPGSRIGKNTFISSNVNIGHDCIVGSGNWINAGVALAGGVETGENCFFGVNSSVSQGVRVGAGNFIGANAFIAYSTGADEVYLSEPGKLLPRMKSKAFLKFSRI